MSENLERVIDPLALYQTQIKEMHAQNTAAFFEDLLQKSEVDEALNQKMVLELRHVEKQVSNLSIMCRILIAIFILALVGAVGGFFYFHNNRYYYNDYELYIPLLVGLPIASLVFRLWQRKRDLLNGARERSQAQKKHIDERVAPLNDLFTWDMGLRLVEKTFPAVAFDACFNNGRLQEICDEFNWNGQFGKDVSILQTYSGVLNGNPFLLAKSLNHWMGQKTYRGSLTISWTTQEKGADGKMQTRHHRQILTASVTEPFPEYGEDHFIVYANEAAPHLSFSRHASKLSHLGDGMLDKFRKNRAIRKLEKKSFKSGGNFTVLANREFDSLFGAEDRNHEVEFRLLFTPLAQQFILKLLKDKIVGDGDNFSFIKSERINFIRTARLSQTNMEMRPEQFRGYDIAQMRQFFNQYQNDFMFAFYFALAPLLAIPLYQQHRPHYDIYKNVYAKNPCFWEHEIIANDYADKNFAHPQSVTRNILKTNVTSQTAEGQEISVAAYGFKSVQRVTYISQYGGDGRTHRVPVYWNEYLPVQQTSNLFLSWNKAAFKNGLPKQHRNLFSARLS